LSNLGLARIRRFLTQEVEAVDELTWPELAGKPARIGKWDFEDYRPSPVDAE